jgi:hypothetical protein
MKMKAIVGDGGDDNDDINIKVRSWLSIISWVEVLYK